ncbi:MAG: carbonic anhydrase [Alphaproteobacteria bacterium]|nr:carbonic anhydrase [Alphaproteobacteria bacterium]
MKKTDGAVITEQERSALTPTQLVELLKEGNKRFVGNLKANRNLLKQVNETSDKQHPFAFVLSCIDSRTSVELIFDQGLGDILSCRIAGNVLNDDILGSMEFGCKAIGVKLIMVLGHSGCGAISGACDDIKMGHLTDLLNKIKPAIKSEKSVHKNRNSKNHEFVEKVAMLNVKEVMHEIPRRSEIVREMIKSGKLVLVGGMYNVATGEVEFY